MVQPNIKAPTGARLFVFDTTSAPFRALYKRFACRMNARSNLETRRCCREYSESLTHDIILNPLLLGGTISGSQVTRLIDVHVYRSLPSITRN